MVWRGIWCPWPSIPGVEECKPSKSRECFLRKYLCYLVVAYLTPHLSLWGIPHQTKAHKFSTTCSYQLNLHQLVLGWPKKKAVNAKPLEITDNYFLQGMKGSAEENKKKEVKKVEGEHRAKERFEKRREKVGARMKETGKRRRDPRGIK